jgi:hypothetical protein
MQIKSPSMNFEPHAPHIPPARYALAVFLLIFAAVVLLVPQAWGIKPASDDFPIINEVHRGNQQGVTVFFTHSATGQNYRPFKSLTLWAFGNLPGLPTYAWIRAAHLSAFLALGLITLLWVRTMQLGWPGTIAAGLIIFCHPTLPQAWGSIDGVDSLASTTFLWLGAWCAWRWRARLSGATALVLLCFQLAVGFKEYAFAMAPLSALVALCFAPPSRRWLSAIVLGGAVSIAILVMIIIRHYVVPLSNVGTQRGFEYILLTPRQIAQNFAVLGTGLLFFGNSIWVYVHQSARVLALVAVFVLVSASVIAGGVILRLRQNALPGAAQISMRRWVAFLLLSFVAASFPVWIMFHVSEMYLPPMIVPLALLGGIASDGYRRARKMVTVPIFVIALVGLVSSLWTIRIKIAGLRDVGDRAAAQIEQILSFLPPDAHDKRIAILFDSSQLPPRRTYAVYRMGDEVLLVHEIVLEWPRSGKNLKLTSKTDELLANPQDYDLILRWDAPSQRFIKVSPN